MPDRDIGAVVVLDANGNVVNFTSSGGVSMADDDAFTPATSSFTPVGGIVTADSVDSGDGGAFAMLANRQQKVTLYNSSASEITSWPVTDNAGSLTVDAPVGTPVFVRLSDGASAITALPITDNSGNLSIDDGGNVITVDGSGSAGSAAAGVQTIQGIASMTPVQVGDNSSSLSVDWNGTQPVTGSGNATGALRVELANNGTGLVGLNAGTNAIGKLAANSGVDIGDVDVTSLPALVAGTAYIGKVLPTDRDVTLHTNYAKKYYTNAGAVTDGIIWSPAAGTRWHVVSMFIGVSAAATVTIEDDKAGGDEAVWKHEFAANGGMTINWGERYPLASGEDAADLIVTTSAGNVYITCTGYEI
jgi:hypothetical protein